MQDMLGSTADRVVIWCIPAVFCFDRRERNKLHILQQTQWLYPRGVSWLRARRKAFSAASSTSNAQPSLCTACVQVTYPICENNFVRQLQQKQKRCSARITVRRLKDEICKARMHEFGNGSVLSIYNLPGSQVCTQNRLCTS